MQPGDNDDHPIDAHFYFDPPQLHNQFLTPDHYHYDFAGYDHDLAIYVHHRTVFDDSPPFVNFHDYASACYHDYDHCRSQQYGDDFCHPPHHYPPSEFVHDYYAYGIGDDPIDDHYGASPGDWF